MFVCIPCSLQCTYRFFHPHHVGILCFNGVDWYLKNLSYISVSYLYELCIAIMCFHLAGNQGKPFIIATTIIIPDINELVFLFSWCRLSVQCTSMFALTGIETLITSSFWLMCHDLHAPIVKDIAECMNTCSCTF